MKTFVFFSLLILVVLPFIIYLMIKPTKPTLQQVKPFLHRNIAHRGFHSKDKTIPENSMQAFRLAVENNYGIELDLQYSKDFKIVVFHDETLERICGVPGRVDEYTYDELQQFQLCGQNETIPLFSDVLEMVDGKVPFIIELKHCRNNSRLCEEVYRMLKDYKGDYCIESFNPLIVRWFKKHAPHIYRGQLSSTCHDLKQSAPLTLVFWLALCLTNFLSRPNFIAYNKTHTPLTVKIAHSLGAVPVGWTVRNKDDIKHLETKNKTVIFEFYQPASKY